MYRVVKGQKKSCELTRMLGKEGSAKQYEDLRKQEMSKAGLLRFSCFHTLNAFSVTIFL